MLAVDVNLPLSSALQIFKREASNPLALAAERFYPLPQQQIERL
jgi:hypothetical protein